MIPLIVSGDYNRKPVKPIVVTEPWYEFVEGNPTGMDIRFAAWSSILSGAAAEETDFSFFWFNPATGKKNEAQVIKGKEFIRLSCPEMYPGVTELRDWVLYIKNCNAN